MISYEGIDRNFKFMIIEVTKQLERTYKLMEEPSRTQVQKILSGDNYIDILKSIIEKKIISYYRHNRRLDKQSADAASAVNMVTNNLERIADLCANIAKYTQKLNEPTFMTRFQFRSYFERIRTALSLIIEAEISTDTTKALKVCQMEETLNELYATDFDRIKEELRLGENTDDLLVALQILHYLERIGDALLNIGEAILFAATGEKLKFHEYKALDDALHASQEHTGIHDYALDFKYETRSGSRIGKVADPDRDQSEPEAIFKKGNLDKLRREKQNIERWSELIPGISPRVLEFNETEADASLLLEFLDGLTFQDLALSAEVNVIERALQLLQETLNTVWHRSRQDEPVHANYLEQLSSRLDDVLRVHPRFQVSSRQVGSLVICSLEELINKTKVIDQELPAPFRVLIHGDLNTDNIIYNQYGDRLHMIDLYRSREMDYVQDVSVFIVSNFRMPVFEPSLRRRLDDIILSFYHFAQDFADRHEDRTFQARLAMGLIRSFITSTRFELNEDFAKVMHLRSVYLLEKLIAHKGKPWERFQLTLETLTY